MSADFFRILCPYQINWAKDQSPMAIGHKSRRIGWTWAHALVAVTGRVEGKSNYYHSSTDMSAAVEFIDACGEWARAFNAVAKVSEQAEVIDDKDITSIKMEFSNGRKIVAGPSNPKFFRSKGGAVGWDEAAFHAQGRELYKAAHATAMFWGHPLRIWSTPNGPSTYFNHLVTSAQQGKLKASLHTVTVKDAVEQGIVERIRMRKEKLDDVPPVDLKARAEWLAELRSTVPDEDTWLEEYMCVPSTDGGAFLDYELIRQCEIANLQLWPSVMDMPSEFAESRTFYAGYDVARKRDLSVLWVLEKLGDVFWTRMIIELHKTPFAVQQDLLMKLMERRDVKRLCIDATGIGAQLAETLATKHRHRAEEVPFTMAVKADMAVGLLRTFQDKTVRVPKDDAVREDLHKIRKVVTAAKNIRYEATRDEDGHADRFWALALAYHAADVRHEPVRAPLLRKPAGW